MLTWITILLALSTVAGAGCVALGLRGRRLDLNPICRRCGFDLQGRFPWSQPTCPTCPDCGEPLLTYRSVLPGARARRSRLLVGGLMLCFPAPVLLLVGAADSITGGASANIKTTAMLANQVSGDMKGSAALRVLTGRIATAPGPLIDLQPAIERALELQADRSKELDTQWLDLLEAARRRKLLSPTQIERYFKAAFDYRLLTRPVGPHEPITFAYQLLADRVALPPGTPPLLVTLSYHSGSLGDEPLTMAGTQTPLSPPTVIGTLAPNMLIEAFDTASQQGLQGRLDTSWNIEVFIGSVNGPLVAAWTQKASTKVEVGPQPTQNHASGKDIKAHAELERQLRPAVVMLERDGAGLCWASVSLQPSTLASDFVGTLRLTSSDGQEYTSLATITITPSDPRWTFLTAADPTRTPWRFRVPFDGSPAGDSALIELVPTPAFARSSTLATPVWTGGPLRFEGVQLRWTQPPTP